MSLLPIKILLDMNLSPEWVGYLSVEGFMARHWSSLGNPKAPDEEIAQFAAHHGYAVMTGDLDFGILLVKSKLAVPSVIQIRADGTLPGEIGPNVLEALHDNRANLQLGALITIDPTRIRVRLLQIPN